MSWSEHIDVDEGRPCPYTCACGTTWADTPTLFACKGCELYACDECKKWCYSCDEDHCGDCLTVKDFGDGKRFYCSECRKDCEENLCRCSSCGEPRTDLKPATPFDEEEICGPCNQNLRAA